MQVINKHDINVEDWKSFVEWTKENLFLFKNPNFFGELFSINRDFEIENNLIEFYLFNKFILKDRYSLQWPLWLTNKNAKTINEYIDQLFLEFFKDKEILEFKNVYFKIIEYLESDIKDSNIEFNLAINYNKVINELRNSNVESYNKWIVYINKHIHKDLKGFK